MRLLIRLMTYFWLALIPCLAAAVVFGQAQPPVTRISQLHFNNCSAPCWIGITPGETSAAEVNQFLMQTFNSTNSPLSSSVNRYQWFTIIPLAQPSNPDTSIAIEFGVTSGTIDEIRIPAWFANSTPNSLMPLVGDMLSVLGEPACVDPAPDLFSGWSIIYEYSAHVLEVIVADSDHITWTQPVYFLSIRRSNLEDRINRCTSPDKVLPRWTGLMRRPHYQRLFAALNQT